MMSFPVLLMSLFVKIILVWHSEFEMSLMGEVTYFLGLQIKQAEEGTFISQTNYFLELLKKFVMQNLRNIWTHMASNMLIDKYENEVEIYIVRYRGVIGSLHYLIVSKPSIIFGVC